MNRPHAAILIAILAGCTNPEPKPPGFLDRETLETLETLPHVESVEVTPATGKPTHPYPQPPLRGT